jgi:putative membrane protein
MLNVPNTILLQVARTLTQLSDKNQLSDYRRVELERTLTELSNIQGGCERIKSTPIPHSYTILIHRIVAVYVFSLPFGLAETLHQLTPLVVLMVAYTFLGLDAVGDEIENPFGYDPNDLPLTALSTMIEINLRQALGESSVPESRRPVNGILN